ncbi:MAG: hypothetical protein K6E95_00015, partial [Lachnospiraceae bacterium]|nr:hypothetical protein [Lachnospiraceae bacterium]
YVQTKLLADDDTCPYCKGTGYLFEGFDSKPEWNDGTTNVPKEGDIIRCVGSQSRYTFHKKASGYQLTRESELLEESRAEALKKLEDIYKKYKEKYYTAKKYKKLTKIYNKTVKKVKKIQDRDELLDTCYAGLADMTAVQPTGLRKYQVKLGGEMLQASYDISLKYEKAGVAAPNDILDEKLADYMRMIGESTTKSKSKKLKNAYMDLLATIPEPEQ